MRVIKLPETGENFIDYETTKKSITFGDEDLSINLKTRERDYDVTIDICADWTGALVASSGADSMRYIAQVLIPARKYDEVEKPNPNYNPDAEDNTRGAETIKQLVPMPFNIDNCTLTLWEMEE